MRLLRGFASASHLRRFITYVTNAERNQGLNHFEFFMYEIGLRMSSDCLRNLLINRLPFCSTTKIEGSWGNQISTGSRVSKENIFKYLPIHRLGSQLRNLNYSQVDPRELKQKSKLNVRQTFVEVNNIAVREMPPRTLSKGS